jgi:hypothetical protein
MQKNQDFRHMGMNYYCISKPCITCGESKDKRHIGKSSCGWTFLFEAYPLEGPTTYKEWIEELYQAHKLIVNEENEFITVWDFNDIIHRDGRQKIMMSSARMALGNGLNEKEKEYLMDDRRRSNFSHLEDSYYLDEEGYGFSRHSFS